jgi:hypothetical protein
MIFESLEKSVQCTIIIYLRIVEYVQNRASNGCTCGLAHSTSTDSYIPGTIRSTEGCECVLSFISPRMKIDDSKQQLQYSL